MSHTFDAIDFVTLPRLNTAEAVGLASALVSRGHALAPLPMDIGRSLGRLENALDAVYHAVHRRMGRSNNAVARTRTRQFLAMKQKPIWALALGVRSFELIEALRRHVVEVVALAAPHDHTSTALAHGLLEPLHNWQSFATRDHLASASGGESASDTGDSVPAPRKNRDESCIPAPISSDLTVPMTGIDLSIDDDELTLQ